MDKKFELYRGADGSVSNAALRHYLDTMAAYRRSLPGLHNVTITVHPLTTQLDLLRVDSLGDPSVTVRVGGEHWDS